MLPRERIKTILLFLILSALDVAFNAAAGPAAVAAGARVNGDPLTNYALGVGATAGATKAGLLAFVSFLKFADLNIATSLFLIIVASVFGVCVIVTAQVSNVVLGETPSQLLIAAVVAALPLQGEGVSMYYTVKRYRADSQSGGPPINTFNPCSVFFGLTIIGSDALGGYTFARMAQNQNYPVCGLHSAAAAGAVYGVLAYIPKAVAYLAWGVLYGLRKADGDDIMM